MQSHLSTISFPIINVCDVIENTHNVCWSPSNTTRVAVACGVLVCAYGQICFWLMASNRQTQKLRSTLFRAVLKQEIGWFDTHEVGELNNRLTELVPCTAYKVVCVHYAVYCLLAS